MAANMPMSMPMNNFMFQTPPGVPPYPGTPDMNANPLLQNNPMHDGLFAHGLTSSPYENALFEDINRMTALTYSQNMPQLGTPPTGPSLFQGNMPMPMPPTGPMPAPTGEQGGHGATGGEGSHGSSGSEGGHGSTSGGHGSSGEQSNPAPGSTLNQHA
jgi:hypothetical protein